MITAFPRTGARFATVIGLIASVALEVPKESVAQDEPRVLWERTFAEAELAVLDTTSDGGYILAGYAGDRPYHVVLIKTDALGRRVWSRDFPSFPAVFTRVFEADDGGFVLFGRTGDKRGVCVASMDSRGDSLRQDIYMAPGKLRDIIVSQVLETEDGYILVGSGRLGNDLRTGYALKLRRSEGIVWTTLLGHPVNAHGGASAVAPTRDGGYIIIGWVVVSPAPRDVALSRLDGAGNVLWTRVFGTPNDESGRFVRERADGGFDLVAGKDAGSGVYRNHPDFYFARTDENGELIEEKGLRTGRRASASVVQATEDGGYLLFGGISPDRDVYIARVNSRYELLWDMTFGGPGGHAWGVEPSGGHDYVVSGQTSSAGDSDIYLFKISVPSAERPFRRGDAAADGDANLTDAVFTLNHLFLGGPAPACADAADADDNGDLEITDPVYTLNFLFLGGAAIPEPAGAECGMDPTDDDLGCDDFTRCP